MVAIKISFLYTPSKKRQKQGWAAGNRHPPDHHGQPGISATAQLTLRKSFRPGNYALELAGILLLQIPFLQ
jgi:hypothetical protein